MEEKQKGKTRKIIGVLILLLFVAAMLYYVGTTEAVNKNSGLEDEEEISTEETVTDDGYDITYDENGNMTPESMQNIVNQELHKGWDKEITEPDEITQEMALEEKWRQEHKNEPPTGAKPW